MYTQTKSFLSLALALCLVLTLLPSAAFAADANGFIIDENGVLTRYDGPGGAVTIPNGVTSIGHRAFDHRSDLTSLTIPDSVTSIGSYAFYYCSNLTNLTIPNSVVTIEDNAFLMCFRMSRVTIPDSVTTIGDSAFYGCGLKSVTLPNSVTSIGAFAFHSCLNLPSITIPASVTSIGEQAFVNCISMTSIEADPNSQTYASADGVLFTKDMKTLVAYPVGKKGAYAIPNSVTSIGDKSFYECRQLTGVVIPDSVTSIGNCAFYLCVNLSDISIPDSVTSIGDRVFYCCDSITSMTIPNGVPSVGEGTFIGCRNLTSVTIPDSVTSIGDHAFQQCFKLTNVTIPDGVTEIGAFAFESCYAMTSVTIPYGVTSIKRQTFCLCDNLTSLTIPSSVTSIGVSAISSCEKLTDIYYGGTQEQWRSVKIGPENFSLAKATIHYNSSSPQPEGQFADVPPGSWYDEPVRWAVSKNITKGTGANMFSPNYACTNAEIITFLYRAEGSPASNAVLPFAPKDAWSTDALKWAYGQDIIDANFNEIKPCTRATAVDYIWKVFGCPSAQADNKFTDLNGYDSYKAAISWAVSKGIVTGTSATTFSPDLVCDRATIVTLLYRAYR